MNWALVEIREETARAIDRARRERNRQLIVTGFCYAWAIIIAAVLAHAVAMAGGS